MSLVVGGNGSGLNPSNGLGIKVLSAGCKGEEGSSFSIIIARFHYFKSVELRLLIPIIYYFMTFFVKSRTYRIIRSIIVVFIEICLYLWLSRHVCNAKYMWSTLKW